MSQGARTRLVLVKGFKQLALRERLMVLAPKHFPIAEDANEAERQRIENMRRQWVEARIALGDAQPKVTVGNADAVKFPRQLPQQLRKGKFK